MLELGEEAFRGATAFNHNLCSWGPQLSSSINGTEIELKDMFENSGCFVTDDPEIPFGPFCHVCTEVNATHGENTTVPANESNFASFSSTEELYQAVDEYMEAVKSSSTETSPVLAKYGPIETWNVSLVSSFRSVFDANRNSADLSLFGNPFFPTGEAGGCKLKGERLSWDMSSAEDLQGMVRWMNVLSVLYTNRL